MKAPTYGCSKGRLLGSAPTSTERDRLECPHELQNCPWWTELARQGVESSVQEGVPYFRSGNGKEGNQRRSAHPFCCHNSRGPNDTREHTTCVLLRCCGHDHDLGSQRVYTSTRVAAGTGACTTGRGRGRASGEGACYQRAASTGTATRKGTCRGSAIRREGNARIPNIAAKAFEHTRTPTRAAEERTRHEEGTLLVYWANTCVGLGHGHSAGVGGMGGVGGVGRGDRRNCQPSTRI